MQVNFICNGCGAQYRIAARLAGRTGKCKRCGHAFTVPNPPVEVVELDPLSSRNVAPGAMVEPDSEHDLLEPLVASKTRTEPQHTYQPQAAPILPPIVTDAILPLLLLILSCTMIAAMVIPRAMHSANPIIAWIIFAFALLLYAVIVVPLSFRAVESSAQSSDYELPNAFRLQTVSAICVPTAVCVFGFFLGGASGLIIGAGIGLVAMSLLMALMFAAPPAGAILTGLFASIWFSLGSAAVAAIAGIMIFFLSLTFTMPWHRPDETQVAQNTPAPSPAPSPSPSPSSAPSQQQSRPEISTSEPKSADASKVAVAVATPLSSASPPNVTIAPFQSGPKWLAMSDPQPAPNEKWPVSVRQMIQILPGANVIHSSPPGPFVAIAQGDSVAIYDARVGRRVGAIKQAMDPNSIVLNSAGTYLAGASRPAEFFSNHGARPITPVAIVNSTSVYSVADGREVSRFENPSGGSPRKHLWFGGNGGLIVAGRDQAGPAVVVRDLRVALPPKSLAIDATGESAVSPGGNFLATIMGDELKLFSLHDGTLANQIKLSGHYSSVRALSFSPDGSEVALLTDAGMTGWRLTAWDMNTGETQADATVTPPHDPVWTSDNFQWLSDNKGVLLGNDLIDVGSGKTFYTITPLAIGSRIGQLVCINWPDQALFEFSPVRNTGTLIYRTAPLPRSDLEVALKVLRPPTTAPANPSTAPSLASAKMSTTASGTVPATQPIPLNVLVQQKQWTVAVVAVVAADLDQLASQSRDDQAKISDLDKQIATAQQQLNSVSSAFTTEAYVDALGRTRQRRVYDDAAIGQASSAVGKLQDEEHAAKQDLAMTTKLQTVAKFQRAVTARLPDNSVCQIDIDTQPLSVIADTMAVDSNYTITGSARILDGVLHVHPGTISPAK